jgi:hypothetical protein
MVRMKKNPLTRCAKWIYLLNCFAKRMAVSFLPHAKKKTKRLKNNHRALEDTDAQENPHKILIFFLRALARLCVLWGLCGEKKLSAYEVRSLWVFLLGCGLITDV